MSAWDQMESEELDAALDFESAADEIESALPMVLSGDLDEIGADEALEHLASSLSPAEAESFGRALRRVGRWAARQNLLRQVAGGILPYAGTGLGALVGGPFGAALGRRLASHAGQAISGARPSPALIARGAIGAPPLPAPPLPAGGSSSAAKLLYLTQNPAFLSSLVSMALGSQGNKAVSVGGGKVPVGAFLNLVSKLAGEALQDADSASGDGESVSDWYLKSPTGCLTCDPSVPGQRADALLRVLAGEDEAMSNWEETFEELAFDESAWDSESWEE